MPTTAYLRVGIESSEAKAGADQAAASVDKVARASLSLDSTLKRINSTILNVARGFSGFSLALSAIGFGAWLRDIARSEAALLSFSDRTGISVETLSVMDYQLRKGGKSFADFENAIGNMTRVFDDANQGSDEASTLLGRLGIKADDVRKSYGDMNGQLQLVTRGMNQVGNASKAASIGAQIFGRNGDAVGATLVGMIANLPKARAELDAMGGVLTRKDAVAAQQADHAFTELEARSRTLGGAFITKVNEMGRGYGYLIAALVHGEDPVKAFGEGVHSLGKEAEQAARAAAKLKSDAEKIGQEVTLEKATKAIDDEIAERIKLRTIVGQTADARAQEEQRVEAGVATSKAAANANAIEATKRKDLLEQYRLSVLMLARLNSENQRAAQANALIQGIRDTSAAMEATSEDTQDMTEKLKLLGLMYGFTEGEQRKFEEALDRAQRNRRRKTADLAAGAFVTDLEREIKILRQASTDPALREADIARLQTIDSFNKQTEAIKKLTPEERKYVDAKREELKLLLAEKAALEALATGRELLQNIKDETELLGLNNEERERRQALRDFDKATKGAAGSDELKALRAEYEARVRLRQELEKLHQLAQDVAQTLAQGFEDAILKSDDLKESLHQLYLELARIGLRTFLTTPLTNFLASLFSGLGGAGGLFHSAHGNAFQGGSVIPFATGGVVRAPTYFPLRNGTGLLGESGPEAVMPLRLGPQGLSVRSDILGGLLPIGRIGGDLGVKLFGQGGLLGAVGAGGGARSLLGTGGDIGTVVHLTQNITIRGGGGESSSGQASRRSARQVAGDFRRALQRTS